MYVLKGIGDYHPDVKKLPQARPPVKPGALPKSTLKPRISAVDVTSITFSSSSTRIAVCGGCSVEISPLQTVQICGGSCGKKCHVGCIGAGRECTKCKSPANKCAQCTEDIPTGARRLQLQHLRACRVFLIMSTKWILFCMYQY